MDDVVILVLTCDRYSMTWPPFCHGMEKYWPDRPWPIHAITNHLDFPCAEVTIKVGDDRGWSSNIIRALEACKAPILLPVHDDFWLTGPVYTEALMEFADHIRHGRADRIDFWDPEPGHRRYGSDGHFEHDPRLFILAPDARYRCGGAAALWRREEYLKMQEPGWTAWNVETHSMERSEGNLKYVCVRRTEEFGDMGYFPYSVGDGWSNSVVWKGEWTDGARKYARQEGLDIDFSKSPGFSGYKGEFAWAKPSS